MASGQVYQARGEKGGGEDVHEDRSWLRGPQGRREPERLRLYDGSSGGDLWQLLQVSPLIPDILFDPPLFRYYKRRLAPKIDVRLVVLTLITVMSMVQYYSAWYNHAETIKYLATVPRYRIQALDIAKVRGMLVTEKKGATKETIRKREEVAIKEIIEELMDQNGGYPKPELNQILWIQIIRFPRSLYEFVRFHLDWIWRFYILRHEYSDTEKEYIVRRRLGMTEKQWSSLEAAAKRLYMDRRLWEAEAWAEWEEEREEEERRRRAESGRSKQERRWEKRGDNRMTFDENYEWDE